MKLNELLNNYGAKKVKKRVGRGIGSGKGKTAGRGVKGQKSRSGVSIKGFEGGQMPLIKRLPKRGFASLSKKKIAIINIEDIQNLFEKNFLNKNDIINKEKLLKFGLIKNLNIDVKLLASNKQQPNIPLTFDLNYYSKSARKIIETTGGQIL